ncbi:MULTISPECIES: hydroxymethylglutaryl-CoA reductase, degradative [unclassified Lacticaseibacillus]|uniref:hydroxymethylglutaryl-CoA reductase, degradative n=1 Tax=unclassified Lacticaseibacillus TaxID=2759744 RepID=UPI00194429FE|nr:MULTISPECIES: hydroxymethylglutaryl-CoA reductase, degradative [unclassified Lacticaseibacillus]
MTKFYEQTPEERRAQLIAEGALTAQDAECLAAPGLHADVAANLSENQIGQYALPIGVARNLTVNGVVRQVALATEEPSVVAAASNGARLANLNGGVKASAEPHRVIAEVVFDGLADNGDAERVMAQHRALLFAAATAAHPSAVKRGGGFKELTCVRRGRFFVIQLTIDPSLAMGANLANTIAEAVATAASGLLDHPALVAILTNGSSELVRAEVTLSPATIATEAGNGIAIAAKIAALSDLAQSDPMRAATHNKGIMNGIDASVLATGNDTRAVAAAISAYSKGQPLSTWQLEGDQLVGRIKLPLPVGVVGGAISALPKAQAALRLGGFDTVADLQMSLAALGLVQNLAALRALAGPGIQAGHMALQARALAMAAGATGTEIEAVAAKLTPEARDLTSARQLLNELRGKQ